MARRGGGRTTLQRVLMFIVILVLSLGVAVVAAHQEQTDAGVGIAMTGFFAIGGTAWFVAWRRGAWRLGKNGALTLFFVGLIAVGAAGSHAVQVAVLAARGEPVDAVVVARGAADSDGFRTYTVRQGAELEFVLGDLRTEQDIADGQAVTVLVDRGEFVRPALPDDVHPVPWLLLVLAGVGLFAVSTIGLGFPLGAGRRAESTPEVV